MRGDPVLSLLGLCARAGGLVSGETQTEAAIRGGSARLVILSTDASHNTAKKFHDKCKSYGVPLMERGTRESLGHAIGRPERSSVAVTDAGFADAIAQRR